MPFDQNNTSNSVSRNQSISPVRKQNLDENSQIVSSDDEKTKDEDDDDELILSDLDDGDAKNANKSNDETVKKDLINLSHEDLSDVSDLESAPISPEEVDGDQSPVDGLKVSDLRQKIEERKQKQNGSGLTEALERKNDEDALDFEAEEGECREVVEPVVEKKDKELVINGDKKVNNANISRKKVGL